MSIFRYLRLSAPTHELTPLLGVVSDDATSKGVFA